MNEKDLFNKDSMYWREVNFSAPDAIAELDLNESINVDGQEVQTIICSLLPFEGHVVEYNMENGGSFKKNEVKAWPYVLIDDLVFYNDQSNPEEERQLKVKTVSHDYVHAITLKDKSGNVILKKEKT